MATKIEIADETIIADQEHIERVLRHQDNVKRDCELLGWRLINNGEKQLGIDLISAGQVHDNSKLSNRTEFLYLRDEYLGQAEFRTALLSHTTTNKHHPEAWDAGISEMPRLYLAEMVCDWHSRSNEFGSDVLKWVRERAAKKYNFSTSGRVYKEIKEFFGLLLDKPF